MDSSVCSLTERHTHIVTGALVHNESFYDDCLEAIRRSHSTNEVVSRLCRIGIFYGLKENFNPNFVDWVDVAKQLILSGAATKTSSV